MNRLFTFGCSFTKYAWPTWADFLGLEFDEYQNWGMPGIGNVAILNRLAECIVKNNIDSKDTVVVQWTSHLRNDYHTFRKRPGYSIRNFYTWKTNGSIFNYVNQDLYDKRWIFNFFDENSYVMLTLNSIFTAQQMLKQTGCKFVMTTIGDLEKLGSDFLKLKGDGEKQEQEKNLWNDMEIFSEYRSKIYEDENLWVSPIGLFAWQDQELLYSFTNGSDTWIDTHPSLDLHALWVEEKLKPSLGLDYKINDKQLKLLQDIKKIKQQTNSLEDFGNLVEKTVDNFDSTILGY